MLNSSAQPYPRNSKRYGLGVVKAAITPPPLLRARTHYSICLQFWCDKSPMPRDGAMYSAISQKPANLIRLMPWRTAHLIRSKAHGSFNSHHQAVGLCVGEAASSYQEAGSGNVGRPHRNDQKAP